MSNKIYHFASVGKEKTFNKLFGYYGNTAESYKDLWDKYPIIEPNTMYGYPDMHHSLKGMGIMLYPGDLNKELSYFDFKEASKDLNV